jgi:hypothetical protein
LQQQNFTNKIKPINVNSIKRNLLSRNVLIACISIMIASACGRESSAEGRMSIQLDLQKEMIDSLRQQNREILDSLGKLRTDINQLQQIRK